ncbi:unnamed protein product [Clonostachys rosea f. rosea IK726]|uniref:Uncharacterized protein n=1 Tax=Clonostachys rosea f. rosea IK726 TaxID=1349383 RepID=A0ACA9URK3_BIOOC|nr:unnamed protein product [Clonostachys rosea f. rosea IK726]
MKEYDSPFLRRHPAFYVPRNPRNGHRRFLAFPLPSEPIGRGFPSLHTTTSDPSIGRRGVDPIGQPGFHAMLANPEGRHCDWGLPQEILNDISDR